MPLTSPFFHAGVSLSPSSLTIHSSHLQVPTMPVKAATSCVLPFTIPSSSQALSSACISSCAAFQSSSKETPNLRFAFGFSAGGAIGRIVHVRLVCTKPVFASLLIHRSVGWGS
ncbi:hypothetical protein AA313_de0207571 [Arthrobotrys entomopaga]|nr:hypothetical protein AA313_de0207571 [Arthrobotrys entomopaga]